MKLVLVTVTALVATLPYAFGQKACPQTSETPLMGVVRDSTLASIPGATVVLDAAQTATSTADGQFRFACVISGRHTLSVAASGFADAKSSVNAPHVAEIS